MKDYTITEFTKLVNTLCLYSSNINYYLLEEEKNNFEGWLFREKNIGANFSDVMTNEEWEKFIDVLIQNETINIKDHIYLSLRESEKIINQLMNKINL
tara:strand:- start:54 stop:347 length:294 start_codon:yes stop_codon:yes gene_type:complete